MLKLDQYDHLKEYIHIDFEQIHVNRHSKDTFKSHPGKLCTDEYLQSIMGKYYQPFGAL